MIFLCTVIAFSEASFAQASTASAGRSFSVKPVPAWTQAIASEKGEGAEAPGSGAASLFLLDDHQTRVSETGTERFYHHVKKVLTSASLEDESELRLEFEPSYQELVIYYVRSRRGEHTIDALKLAIKVHQ